MSSQEGDPASKAYFLGARAGVILLNGNLSMAKRRALLRDNFAEAEKVGVQIVPNLAEDLLPAKPRRKK